MPESKRIVVVGATGTIGKALCKGLIEHGYDVVIFSRNPDAARIWLWAPSVRNAPSVWSPATIFQQGPVINKAVVCAYKKARNVWVKK